MTVLTTAKAARSTGHGRVGGVEFFVYGEGEPVTVFAHGLAGSISETKPLAMPLAGTRVLFNFQGHGNSDSLDVGWDYDLLAANMRNVADHVGATRACGLSLGAGALMRILLRDPGRFDRLAFVMPAALDQPRTDGATRRLRDLGAAIESGDRETLTQVLMNEIPADLRELRVTRILLARRAAELAKMTPPAPSKVDVPIPDLAVLRDVKTPALVLAQRDDQLHSVAIARTLARALPAATLRVLEPGGVFWTQPDQTRMLLAQHLTTELAGRWISQRPGDPVEDVVLADEHVREVG
jgi:pimeloyl-ACP methyl ester carboxylesterase